ncbi:phosphoribosylglycinamide formyltransferase [Flavobacteriales bacterium]|nr:phosphoribosylglycinamide formyltransferase [Flavobacteriales bacterium]
MKKICILASGDGSNAENIIRYFKDNESIQIAIVASNSVHARVLNRAKKHNIESFYFTQDQLSGGILLEKLISIRIDFVVLAGFMLKIPQLIISKFHNKIINIHPSLLPLYGGKGMYGIHVHRAVFKSNDMSSGITIHFVNKNYDEGKIIFQAKCEIKPTYSVKDIMKKVRSLEHKFYPRIIKNIINENN